MSISHSWDETNPAGSRLISLGDDDIRQMKLDIRERMTNAGHSWPSSSDSTSGLHAVGVTGTHDAGEFNIFRSDLTTKAVTLTDSGLNIPVGFLRVAGVDVLTTSAARIVYHCFPLAIGSSGAANTASDISNGLVMNKINRHTFTFRQTTGTATLTEFIVVRPSIPASGTLTFELRKITPTWTTNVTTTALNTGGTNVLTAAFVLAATSYGMRATAFTDASVAPGDTLYVATTGTDGTNLPFTCCIFMTVA